MTVAFLNYLFYPVLSRLLSPSDFGDIQALFSLIAQSGIILGAFSIIAVNIISNTLDENERDVVISKLQKISFYIIGIIFIILLLYIGKLKYFFNFSTFYPLFGLAIILPLSTLITFRNAYLQGTGNFLHLSISGIVASLSKLILAVVFILVGLSVFGATLGIIFSYVLVFIYLFYQTRNFLHLNKKTDIHILEKGRINKELKYGLLVFFATGLVTLFYTSDILIIKHYFSAIDAGLYAGVSVVAKILFFVIAPASTVLFSSVKIARSFKENLLALRKSLIISIILGLGGMITFYFFSSEIVSITVGSKYAIFAYLLPKIGLIMLLTAIINVFVLYFLALRRFLVMAVSLLGMSFIGFMLLFKHNCIDTILNNFIYSLVFILILLLAIYAKDYFNHRSSL